MSDMHPKSWTDFWRCIILWQKSVSLRPDLAQIREMLNGLSKKLPKGATPLLHSDQGWQYQHAEYQRYLKEHNIVQSMSRKGKYMERCNGMFIWKIESRNVLLREVCERGRLHTE